MVLGWFRNVSGRKRRAKNERKKESPARLRETAKRNRASVRTPNGYYLAGRHNSAGRPAGMPKATRFRIVGSDSKNAAQYAD